MQSGNSLSLADAIATGFVVVVIAVIMQVTFGCGDSSGGKPSAERMKEIEAMKASAEAMKASTEAMGKTTQSLQESADALKQSAEALDRLIATARGGRPDPAAEARSKPSYSREVARKMQNGTQVRGIQQSLVTFASGNNGFFTGLRGNDGSNADMSLTRDRNRGTFGAAAPKDNAAAINFVFADLLTRGFFTTDYIISPLEDKTKANFDTDITQANYSYALLQVFDVTADKGRRSEWKDTNNSQCPVVSDRSRAIDGQLATTSVHVKTATDQSADWQGNIAWNDNHVTFETSGLIDGDKIKVGPTVGTKGTPDDIFSPAAAGSLDAATNVKMMYR